MFHWIYEVLEFMVATVIVKGIVAHYLADHLLSWFKNFVSKLERYWLIWQHYYRRAHNQGHELESVLDCGQDGCRTFVTA